MPSLQNLGIGSWPRRRAMLSPDRVAVEFEGTALTFAQFAARVEALSAWLAHQGVGPGDRVAYWGANHVALLETLFASTRIGAICVLVNARLAPAEAEYILTGQRRVGAVLRPGAVRSHGDDRREDPRSVLVDIDGTGTAGTTVRAAACWMWRRCRRSAAVSRTRHADVYLRHHRTSQGRGADARQPVLQ